jgi:hypothetical protein
MIKYTKLDIYIVNADHQLGKIVITLNGRISTPQGEGL